MADSNHNPQEPFSNPMAPPSSHFDPLGGSGVGRSSKHHHHDSSSHSKHQSNDSQPLSNEDFRKLMMTPRSVSGALGGGSVRGKHGGFATPQSFQGGMKPKASLIVPSNKPIGSITDKDQKSSSSKHHHKTSAKSKKPEGEETPRRGPPQDDSILSELNKRYRDRAKERRDDANPDYQASQDIIEPAGGSGAGGYHAVAPFIGDFSDSHAARRRQMIEESKYLGGDMAHTHLVKGLDYALLQKVKAELHHGEPEKDEQVKRQFEDSDSDDSDDGTRSTASKKSARSSTAENLVLPTGDKRSRLMRPGTVPQDLSTPPDQLDKDRIKTRLAQNIVAIACGSTSGCSSTSAQRSSASKLASGGPAAATNEVNELFIPGRMAYVFDIDLLTSSSRSGSSALLTEDIPTAIIRSKAECPAFADFASARNSTHAIVMGKLIQIFANMRKTSATSSGSSTGTASGGTVSTGGTSGGSKSSSSSYGGANNKSRWEDYGKTNNESNVRLSTKTSSSSSSNESAGSNLQSSSFKNASHSNKTLRPPPPPEMDLDIYENCDAYVPDLKKKKTNNNNNTSS